jgi:YD repeat-containing protein
MTFQHRKDLAMVAIAGLALAWGGSARAQNMLADGGFDVQGASVGTYCYVGGCPGGAWVTQSGSGFIREGNPDFGAPAAASPHSLAFLQGTGVLQQTFVATQTGQFRVIWWVAGRAAGLAFGGNQTVSVTVNGVLVDQQSTTSGTPYRKVISSSFPMTAGQSYTLKFVGQSVADNTALIDSISIAPETTSFQYDALGRLVGTAVIGGANDGVVSNYAFDSAGNRTSVVVTRN